MWPLLIRTGMLGALAVACTLAGAEEVKLLAARVLRPVLTDVAADFTRSTGHTTSILYDTAGGVRDRVAAGEAVDVAILQRPAIAALEVDGKMVSGSSFPIARSAVSVGALKGAPKPDVSTVAAFSRALSEARSVAYPDPAIGNASGVQFVKALKQLGLEQMVASKATVWQVPFAEFAPTSADELAVTQAMDILGSPRHELLGPMPAELQDLDAFTWSAGVVQKAGHPDAGKALVEYLRSPGVAAAIRKRGMDPADGKEK